MIDLFTPLPESRIVTAGSFIEQYPEVHKVQALSWKNPFGWLMAERQKIETRVWSTNYRGWVLMCASLAAYKVDQVITIAGPHQYRRISEATTGRESEIHAHRGKAFAIGYLADCRLMRQWDEDRCFVKYRAPWIEERKNKETGETYLVEVKLYAHVYTEVKWIEPFSWRGKQGWSTLIPEEIAKIKILI